MVYSLASLFLTAFLAATILPFSSEALMLGLMNEYPNAIWYLFVAASLGNILGSVLNWVLGRWLIHFQDRRWFPIKQKEIQKAETFFQKWGWPSLLLAWVPIIGDPLTLIAGYLRFSFVYFLILISLAKAGRYFVITLIFLNILENL